MRRYGRRLLSSWANAAVEERWQQALEAADSSKYAAVLRECGVAGDLARGKHAHAHLLKSGYSGDALLGNIAVQMYARCGSVEDAAAVFDSWAFWNAHSWAAMIAANARLGHFSASICLFRSMDLEGVRANRSAILALLGACSKVGGGLGLRCGREAHVRMVAMGVRVDELAGNILIAMYGKCGSTVMAREVFDVMEARDLISWNSMIGAYAQNGHGRESLALFHQMIVSGRQDQGCGIRDDQDRESVAQDCSNPPVIPNEITYVTVLGACSSVKDVEEGRKIHGSVLQRFGGKFSQEIGNTLVHMYCKCGSAEEARSVFDNLVWRHPITCSTLMGIYIQQGNPGEHALCSCSGLRDLEQGKSIHDRVAADGFDTQVFVGNALVNMYSKCRRLDLARAAFERIDSKDVVSWNSMIAAHSQLGGSDEALETYRRMIGEERLEPTKITLVHALGAALSLRSARDTKLLQEDAIRLGLEGDLLVGSALVSALGKCGCLDQARAVFDRMERRNVVSWSGLIAALAEHGRGRDAIELFHRMDLDGIQPNEVTLLSVLEACASTGAIAEGRRTHARVSGCGFEAETNVANALVNMYGKCGHLGSARTVFDAMTWRNVVSWTAMLAGYAHHGHTEEARRVFKAMALEGIQPNVITFVSVLFNCSHAGVVSDGLEQFHIMVGDFGIVPVTEHYGCVIDLLGRAGWLEEAEELLRTMPVEPDKAAWNSLLGACKVHSHTDRAKRIAKLACDLALPFASAPYVLLSNMYTDEEQQSDPEEDQCSSLIEVKGRVHEFVAGDWSHPRIEEIVAELQRLQEEMMILRGSSLCEEGGQEGSVQENEHSLKLAIAFGVLASPQGSTINVVNTRRICVECHDAAKVISKIAGRKIVVRDSYRFHHIEQGVCSCGDYC
ncbi:pentatricopeptide repeat-containing protein At3g24000, mitochondrial [Selaginella moellendorffii]|uniref:pentatricopeptide repeat-containing protein At3g24000, mitochondrial n=1 Tax=Selaginella moellendorffii TaxID=88036 RepID=UPI000D1C9FA9|nr:pentatricopeptide repeat-containing protein At3g24000, mitochondrial [Selaginella moellendorffii]|eukprot:XP_024532523.1 pentatricopeptide repeat-containing protein At3g24000, mitochondrial [Selaginella moellendorffii]